MNMNLRFIKTSRCLVAHSFSSLSNILLYGYAIVCPFIYQGHLGFFQFWMIMNGTAIRSHMVSVRSQVFQSVRKEPRSMIAGHMVRLYLAL